MKTGMFLLIISGTGYGIYTISQSISLSSIKPDISRSIDHSTMNMSEDRMVTYVKPKTYIGTKAAITSYLGEIQTEKNGQIYAYRNGIVDEYLVDIGDTVKKGQRVAVINTLTYTPEVTIMLAEKRADIAIAEGEVTSAKRKLEYIQNTITNPNGNIQKSFDIKKKSLDLQYEVERKQLDIKLSSLRAQLDAQRSVVSSDQINRINNAILTLLEIFYSGDRTALSTSNTSYDFYWGYNSNWGGLGTGDREKIIEIPERFHTSMKSIIKSYPLKIDATSSDLSMILAKLQGAINDANTIYSVISPSATQNYLANKNKLISLFSGDTGLILVNSGATLSQSGGSQSGTISQANTDLIGIEQELRLLESDLNLLESNKKKDLAAIGGDQAMTQVDLEKLRIDAETAKISAESRLIGVKNALSAVQNVIGTSYVTAPFTGKITRRYVNAGESISMSTPLFDIVDISTKSEPSNSFVRFEIPESDILEVTMGKEIRFYRTAEPLRKLKAKIIRISPAIGSTTKSSIVEAEIVENTQNLPVGSTIRVEMEKSGNMLLVPVASVVQGDDGSLSVFTIDAQNIIHSKLVSTERTVGLDVYISSGITKDDRIIELPKNYPFLKDGVKVDPMEKPTVGASSGGGLAIPAEHAGHKM